MKYVFLIFILFSFSIISCEDVDFSNNTPQIVIDGHIDNGGFPIVLLTTSVPVSSAPIELDNLEKHLLRWAKVSINDGSNEIILTGKYDSSYFPPFVYTTGRMRGQTGKTYTIKVEYEDFYATAKTTIPPSPQVDSIKIHPTVVDSLCKIVLHFTDDTTSTNFYKTFVRNGTESRQWKSSYLGIINDDVLGDSPQITINQGSILTDTVEFTPFFNYKDTISIKFCEIDKTAYEFWNDYENHTSLSRNPLFPLTQNLHSNIVGGFGCWYGCGATIIHIPLSDYIENNTLIITNSNSFID